MHSYCYSVFHFMHLCFTSLDKKKVLRHHPDKRRARGLEVKEGEDDYFTCITKGTSYTTAICYFVLNLIRYLQNIDVWIRGDV